MAVIGASGSGKSSIVRAGLLPRLQQGAIEGSRHWRVLTLTPGGADGNPFLALAFELASELPNKQKPAIKIAEELAKEPRRVTEYAATLLAGSPGDGALVMLVDQMEELFTIAKSHQTDFLKLLAHAADDARLRVLATLRADFLSQAVAEPALRPLFQAPAATYLLASPDPLALAEMISRPAERAGLSIEDDMVHAVLKDAGTDLGALPLVAFCLEELYRSCAPARRLTMAAYDDLGRLRGAIGRRAEALLSGLQKTEGMALDAVLPMLFRVLVHVNAAGTATRRRAVRDELVTEPPLLRLIEVLIQGRLLQAEDAGGRATVTLAHEVLLTAWPALHKWVEANRAQLQRLHLLLLTLASDNLLDRRHAVKVLSDMPTVMPEAVPALITTLADANGFVRREAVTALGRIEPAAAEAVPALIAALADADRDVRRGAAAALGEIGPAAAEAVPALIAALADADGFVRREAVTALGRIEPAAAEAVPALIAALADAYWDVRRGAAAALGEIGPAAAEAVPALITALADADETVRQGAVKALGRIGPEVVPALITALANAGWPVRQGAVKALGRIGPEVVPALITALANAGWPVRRGAAAALGRIGPAAAEAAPALIITLADAGWPVRGEAAAALGEIGPAAAEAAPALITALADTNRDVRREAAKALVKIGPEAVPALITALANADGLVHWGAAAALGRIGPAAAEAAPALITRS